MMGRKKKIEEKKKKTGKKKKKLPPWLYKRGSKIDNKKWVRDPCTNVFRIGNVVGKGITSLISKHFFHPEFSLKHVSGESSTSSMETESGSRRGITVEKQLKQWIQIIHKPKKWSEERLKKKLQTFWPTTRNIISLLRQKQWIPIATQRVVGCKLSRVATAFDLVAKTWDGKLVLIELKSGYKGTFAHEVRDSSHPKWRMLPPFQDLYAHPLHYSLIQLQWGWILHSQSRPEKIDSLEHVVVINANEETANAHSIPVELGQRFRKRIIEIMLERRRKK